ncbi:MAG: DUF3179 domain-containing protein, partial [Pseudomonadales bacterium]
MYRSALVALCLLTVTASPVIARGLNGFDVSNATIPKSEILHGGPPRDGIPAINVPRYLSAEQADFLRAEDR